MGLLEPFEHRGLWWLPEAPFAKVAGVLTFSQDGVALELIGQLPRERPEPDATTGEVAWSFMPASRDRILGETTSGKGFTLDQCQATSLTLGGMSERFRPEFILEGAHYDAQEPVVFDELSVRYTQLDAWVAISGFDTQTVATEGESLRKINVSFSPPAEIRATVPGVDIAVDFSVLFRPGGPTRSEVSLTQHAAFHLHFHRPTSLKAALDTVYHLRNFVALGVGRPVTPIEITGFVLPQADAKRDELTGLEPRKQSIRLYYRLAHVSEEKEMHPAQMLFTLVDARDRLQALLDAWFSKRTPLAPVFDLYFGALYNRQSFVEQQFLSLMQALETTAARRRKRTSRSQTTSTGSPRS